MSSLRIHAAIHERSDVYLHQDLLAHAWEFPYDRTQITVCLLGRFASPSRIRVNTARHAFDGGSGQAWEDGPGEALAAQAGYGPSFPGFWPSWVNSWMTDPPFTVLPSRLPRVHCKLTGRLRHR
jgi:hypothetical protein